MMGSRKTRMTLTIDPDVKSSCQEVLQGIGVPLSRAVEGYLSALAEKGSFLTLSSFLSLRTALTCMGFITATE